MTGVQTCALPIYAPARPLAEAHDDAREGENRPARADWPTNREARRVLGPQRLDDLLEAKRIRGKYPTQKPVEILQRIIVNSSQIGDLVIDPFAGSGSTGVAAIASDRRFAGCDINPASNGIYLQRLMDEIPILKGSQNANQSAPSDPSIACEDSDE